MTDLTVHKVAGYGWSPSLPDARDLIADTAELPVHREVDPRGEYMTPVYGQLQLGSCTYNTVAEAVDADRIVNGQEPLFPSRLVGYALERIIEGSPLTADTGAWGRDGYKVSRKIGMLPERLVPYTDRAPAWQLDPRPLFTEHADLVCKLERPYKAVRRSLREFKRVLSNRQTIGFGFTVYESFESDEVARTGLVPMPTEGERTVGGHEVLLVGYLADMPHHGLVRNHWTERWGIDGYCLMPWAYLLDPHLSSDFRTIYRPAGA